MHKRHGLSLGLGVLLASASIGSEARGATPLASGVLIEGHLQTLLPGSLAVPSLGVGIRLGDLTLGLGASWGHLGIAESATREYGVSVLQLMPFAGYDVWSSPDDSARLEARVGVGYSMLGTTYSSSSSESEDSVGLLTVLLGAGGDYWLHPSFAIGLEAGLTLTMVVASSGGSVDEDEGGSLTGLYGAGRMKFLVGL